MDSSSLSHTKWKCQYHIVFIPKYRKKDAIWSGKERCKRDHKSSLQVQKSRNRRRCSMRRSCTFVRKHSTEIKCIKFHGVSERKEYTHDI